MSQAIRTAKAQRLARVSVVLGVLFALSAFGVALSSAAPPAVQCNGVFDGATPNDPILKTASVSEAYPGGSVTYTIQWTATGADTADVTDCFRVDDGSDDDLNAIVEGLSYADDRPNDGGAGVLQTWEVTVEIPNDDDLIGHSVVNRVKITNGSVESRSDYIEVAIVEPPCTENCGGEDGSTDDGSTDDGSTDDGSTDDGSTDDGSTDDGSTDDGSTDDGSTDDGSTDDGSTDDGSTDGTPTDDGSSDDDGTVVQGTKTVKKKPQVLAQTGPETTVLSIIGSLLLMAGIAMRYGFRPAFAGNTQAMVAEAIRRRNRSWTCKG